MLAKVELPYRVIDVAAGDLGSSAARKFDCEAWVPTQGRYREVTSTSNCTTFQARRLGVRYRDADGTTPPVATLNGTLATTRWIVAILENHQQPDGSVRVPEGAAAVPGRPRGAGAAWPIDPACRPASPSTSTGRSCPTTACISDGVREAVRPCADAGLHVVLATGRACTRAVPVATELGLTEGWVVCSNGAVTARLDPAAENGYEIAGS